MSKHFQNTNPQATRRPHVETFDYEQAIDLGRKHAGKRPYSSTPDRLDEIHRAEQAKRNEQG